MDDETKVKQKPSLFGMVTSPVQQFKRIREQPLIWGAISLVVFLTAIGGALQAAGVDMPDMNGLGKGATTGVVTIMIVTTIITSIVVSLFIVLITSVIHIIVAKIASSTVSFKQLFSMNTYILMITALGAVLNGIVSVIVGTDDPEIMFTSLGSMVHTQGAMAGLWDSIEIFSIWQLIVTAIGLQIVAGFSKKLAWTLAIALFIIGVILSMIGATTAGMMDV